MKAYKLACADFDHGQKIVFAENSRAARQSCWPDRCDCAYIEQTVRRAPKLDKYAPGPLTIEDYLAEGWFWECHDCGEQCWAEDNPVVAGELVFCNEACFRNALVNCEKMCVPGAHESWFRSREMMRDGLRKFNKQPN